MSDEGAHEASGPERRIPDAAPRHTPLWALLSRWLLKLEAWLRSHGGRGLRLGLRAFWGFVGAVGIFLLVGPVINPPMSLDELIDSAGTATETWIARDFDADYVLTRDDEGRLRAEVTETITAFFPEGVDESGIQRVIATQWEGHAVAPRITGAEIDGSDVTPAIREGGDRLTAVLDTGERLEGDHEFVIRYTLQDLAVPTVDDDSGQGVDMVEWSIYGPDWPQAVTGIDVTVSVPQDVADALIRQPRGDIAWTLISGGDWLDPEPDSPPGESVYAFTSSERMPPNSQAWFTMPFAAGTFTMPPVNPVFLLQSFGPLLPLAFLVVTLLFSLAARAVAWGDARGRPWYVAQYDPPKGVSPGLAAHVLRTPRTRELAGAIADFQDGARGSRRDQLVTLGRAAHRTGRVGDLFRAVARFAVDPERARQFTEGLRRIPRGFVRDWFILSPIAIALLQIGLVRQLNEQTTLAIVWWPGAFFVASVILAVIVIAVARSARPLTRRGALVRQHLLGIRAYAEQTALVARPTLKDRLLPYAVLSADPREAGRLIAATVEEELGGRGELAGWRTPDFLAWPRLIVRTLALVIVAGAIAIAAFAPNPYERDRTFDDWDFSSSATLYTLVEAVDIDATLSAPEGRPRIDVVQRAQITAEEDAYRPPQFAQMWPTTVDGQDVGLEISTVRLDGEEIPFELTPTGDRVEMLTRIGQVLEGDHEIEVEWSLDSPVTAGLGSPLSDDPDGPVDRIRWTALLEGWNSGWAYPSAPDVTVSLAIDDALAARADNAGWLRLDPDTAEEVRDWRESLYPLGTLVEELSSPYGDPGEIDETTERAGGFTTHTMRTTEGDGSYPTSSLFTDLGVLMEFPPGTFPTDAGALKLTQVYRAFPMVFVWVFAGLAALIGLVSVVRAGGHSRRAGPGTFRDLAWFLGPAAALAAIIVFVWSSLDMSGDEPMFIGLITGAGVGLLGAIASLSFVRPLKTAAKAASVRRRR